MKEVKMKNLHRIIAVAFFLSSVINIYSQTAYVKWPLTSDQNPDNPIGNIQASQQTIGTGSGSYLLSIYNPYVANGQRLWTGNQGTGWIAGLPDYTRFIQFDASPTTGNDFTIQFLSFRYSDNPLGTDFNIIKGEVWYSIDNWNSKTQLHTTALNYLNTSVQTFSKSLNVLVPNGKTFSLRIYPYTLNGGLAMTPSFATHKDVLIEGTTSAAESDTCETNSVILNTGWNYNTSSAYANPGTDQDVFWTLINAPMSNGPVNLNGPAWVIDKHPAWAQPGTGSQYISAFQTYGSNLANGEATDTPYVFSKKICVGELTDLIFNFKILVDNRAEVKFVDANGTVISTLVSFSSSSTANFTAATNVNQTLQNITPGTYYLLIELRNDHVNTAMGVNLQGTVTGSSSTLINSLCCNPPGSSISGYKFEDTDNDGIKDPSESFLSGWIINLSGNNITQTSTTDVNGNYLFTGLSAGTYTISETAQSGWVAGVTGDQHSVAVGANQAVNNINFGNLVSSDPCISLSATAVKTSPDDCSWSLSLTQPAILTGVSSIQIMSLAPNQFTTGTGLGVNFQNWFTTGTNTYTSPSGTVTGGNLNNFFTINLSYVTSPQVVVVNWLNESGTAVCSDTLRLNCEIPCATIEIDSVECVGSHYNISYSFTNNATYSVSNVEYTLQGSGNISIAPLAAQLSSMVQPGANSGLQNILISGAVPGDIVNILVKFNSPDGCCWCYETISVTIPNCNTVCDSLSVQAKGNPEDCCYSISLTNNSSTKFSNVEFELLSGGMFSTVSTTSAPGWGFTNVFPNNVIKLVKFPLTSGIATGNYSDVLDMCIRQYTSPNQVVAVRWIKDGQVICTDTLKFECAPLEPKIDSCSQAINGTLTCLPNGTYKYEFRVQNNSSIMSTGYGIYPTTPGVTFSQTIFNTSIMPGQVSPVTTIIIAGIGAGQNLCFQTAVFTVVPGQTAYNYCCHSDTMCITVPICGGKEDCTPPPSGMMGWWPGDNNANDISGFNNHGTLFSSIAYANGKVDKAFSMSPDMILPEFIVVQDNPALNFGTGNLTIDAWVRTTDNRGVLFLVDKRAGTEVLPLGYSFYISGGKIGFQMGDGSSSINYSATTSPVADGNWHFVAVSIERNNKFGGKLYVDGSVVLTFDPTAVAGSITNQAKFFIGQRNISFAIPFKGEIDEVEIFNRALADSTIFRIFAAGEAGKCKPKTTSIDEGSTGNTIPQDYQLQQNYPNPFNPSSKIRYDLPKSSFVKISVYDILGKEIAILVNEEKNSGSYEVTFDANGLASGIYFYTIRTKEFSQSRKMILLR